MDSFEADATFQLGLRYFRQNRQKEAANAFRAAFKSNPENPVYLSYYGMIVALAENCLQDGLTFCQAAINRAPYEAELYLNLSRIYLHSHQRRKALESLLTGMLYDKSELLKQEFKRLGVRRKPFFTRLSRNHPLNFLLGKITYRANKNTRQMVHAEPGQR